DIEERSNTDRAAHDWFPGEYDHEDYNISATLLALARHPVPVQIAQVGSGRLAGVTWHLRAGRLALGIELNHPRLDEDPPARNRPVASRCHPATSLGKESFAPRSRALNRPLVFLDGLPIRFGVAAGLADRGLDLLDERLGRQHGCASHDPYECGNHQR